MILHHITECAGSFIIPSPSFNTDSFRSCDLYMINITAVPDRFKKGIGKTQGKEILHGFFAQVMIYAVNLLFIKHGCQESVQLMRAMQIMAKWFFHYYPGAFGISADIQGPKLFGDIGNQ